MKKMIWTMAACALLALMASTPSAAQTTEEGRWADFCHTNMTSVIQDGCGMTISGTGMLVIDNVSVRCTIEGFGALPDMQEATLYLKIGSRNVTFQIPLHRNGGGLGYSGRNGESYAGVVTGPLYQNAGALISFNSNRFNGNIFAGGCTVTLMGRREAARTIVGGQ